MLVQVRVRAGVWKGGGKYLADEDLNIFLVKLTLSRSEAPWSSTAGDLFFFPGSDKHVYLLRIGTEGQGPREILRHTKQPDTPFSLRVKKAGQRGPWF